MTRTPRKSPATTPVTRVTGVEPLKSIPPAASPKALTTPRGIKRNLHTRESLKALGFKEVKPSGKGYGLPLSGPLPRREEDR